ncbi:MAG: twin-arginine translocase TatA/TatE family subunit [Herpetosiphonaceae bacterium]|nr:twin-arginine translocase TatA/TatE family subunit [Herpetosiphonaceae bacterium]
MFGLGIGEIIIILLIAMIVVGPEHLPELAKKVGQTVTDMRRIYVNLRSELGPDFDEVERQVRNLRAMDPRREIAAVGRRVFDGLADEVPELNNLNEATLRQQIIDLQAELRQTITQQPLVEIPNPAARDHPAVIYEPAKPSKRAKTYTVANRATSTAVFVAPAVVERRRSLGRLAHQLLNDDVLDRPIRDGAAVASAVERRRTLGRLAHQLLNDDVLDESLHDAARSITSV